MPVIPRSRDAYAAAHAAFEAALARIAHAPPVVDNPLAETPASRFFLAYHGSGDRELQERLAALFRASCPSLVWTSPHCEEDVRASGPRRIALVCRFLFDHSIGRLLHGLLRRLAAGSNCEVTIHESAAAPDDAVRREIDAAVAGRVVLPCELNAGRSCIAEFQADVAFFPEVGMDPMTYFLAFALLAPVQAVTWGHPVTTGVPNMHYFLSCDDAEPADLNDANEQYSETLVRHDGYPFSYPRPPVLNPPARGRALRCPKMQPFIFWRRTCSRFIQIWMRHCGEFWMAIERGVLYCWKVTIRVGAKPSGNGLPKLCATRHRGLCS